MPEVSATEAARSFSDLLDGVEHRGERYTVIRRGRPVARLEPVPHGSGADVKAALRQHRPDTAWADDLATVRQLLQLDERL
jgi:prevent-host-death family protein